MVSTPESVFDIAGMGAEFPMAVAVDSEFLAAVRADECIDCLPLH